MNHKQQRNYGIDLLRCLSMFFVILQHLFGQGDLLYHAQDNSAKYFFFSFFQIMAYCAVDVYGITTGYLMCTKQFKLSRLVQLWATTVFWSVAVSCCFFVFVPASRTISEAVSMFLPILRGRYWFFTAYFVVMLLSPVLNHLIRTLNKHQFQLLLVVLLLIFGIIPIGSLGYDVMRVSGGNHFSWMIALYLIGGYLRVHLTSVDTFEHRAKNKWLLGYFTAVAIHFLYMLAITFVGFPHYGTLMLTCISPLVTLSAVCLFLHFQNLGSNISEQSVLARFLRFAAPGVYAVYIIHVHPLVFWNTELINLLRPWDGYSGILILACALFAAAGVFLACICLDYMRQKLFLGLRIDNAIQRISNRAEAAVRARLT